MMYPWEYRIFETAQSTEVLIKAESYDEALYNFSEYKSCDDHVIMECVHTETGVTTWVFDLDEFLSKRDFFQDFEDVAF